MHSWNDDTRCWNGNQFEWRKEKDFWWFFKISSERESKGVCENNLLDFFKGQRINKIF